MKNKEIKKSLLMKNTGMKKNIFTKKNLIILGAIILIVVLIFVCFFYKNVNKNFNFGNNLSNKTNQEIEEYILNISSYEANCMVTVESNKNKTSYKIKQSYSSPNLEKQVVEEPSNIAGLETTFDGNKLTIRNTKLDLTTVYENYPYITNNYLWLNSFIQDYGAAKGLGKNYSLYEEDGCIVMEVIMESNHPYVSSKKLFIDKQNNKIAKLVVQDKNKKNLVYILYNEIKINSLKKEEVLAFRLKEVSSRQY